MTTSTKCRRRHRRHRFAPGAEASVKFVYPQPSGAAIERPLVDISTAGFSFSWSDELMGIDDGASLEGATINIGGCEIRGELTVMHISEDSTCGALFHPDSDEDLVKLKTIIAGMDSL